MASSTVDRSSSVAASRISSAVFQPPPSATLRPSGLSVERLRHDVHRRLVGDLPASPCRRRAGLRRAATVAGSTALDPDEQPRAVGRPRDAADHPDRQRLPVGARVPGRGHGKVVTGSRDRASRTVTASPELTAIRPRSGLTATEAPIHDSSSVLPTATSSTTSPVRGSTNVAATSDVPGPK